MYSLVFPPPCFWPKFLRNNAVVVLAFYDLLSVQFGVPTTVESHPKLPDYLGNVLFFLLSSSAELLSSSSSPLTSYVFKMIEGSGPHMCEMCVVHLLH